MVQDRSRPDSGALQEIAGLWERTSAAGRAYIGGRTPDDEDIVVPAGSLVMVFPNASDNPRAPGFRLLFAPPRDDPSLAAGSDGGTFARLKASAPPPQRPTSTGGTHPVAVTAPPETLDDGEDVPF